MSEPVRRSTRQRKTVSYINLVEDLPIDPIVKLDKPAKRIKLEVTQVKKEKVAIQPKTIIEDNEEEYIDNKGDEEEEYDYEPEDYEPDDLAQDFNQDQLEYQDLDTIQIQPSTPSRTLLKSIFSTPSRSISKSTLQTPTTPSSPRPSTCSSCHETNLKGALLNAVINNSQLNLCFICFKREWDKRYNALQNNWAYANDSCNRQSTKTDSLKYYNIGPTALSLLKAEQRMNPRHPFGAPMLLYLNEELALMRDLMFGSAARMRMMLMEKSVKKQESAVKSAVKRNERRKRVDEYLLGIGKIYKEHIWADYVKSGKGKFQELADLAAK